MDAHVLDAKVSGYEFIIETLTLPDPDDRHILAAAIRSNADAIVTFLRQQQLPKTVSVLEDYIDLI